MNFNDDVIDGVLAEYTPSGATPGTQTLSACITSKHFIPPLCNIHTNKMIISGVKRTRAEPGFAEHNINQSRRTDLQQGKGGAQFKFETEGYGVFEEKTQDKKETINATINRTNNY